MTHGFATSDGSTFNDVDFPGATNTQAIDVNDAGDYRGRLLRRCQRRAWVHQQRRHVHGHRFPGSHKHCGRRNQRQRRHRRRIYGYNGITHGFLLSGGVFTPINFPLASSTTAFGINDNGDIAGFYTDTAGKTHGFVYADNNFSTVDVAGASATQLTRIKNWEQVTGVYVDALTAEHGLTGQ